MKKEIAKFLTFIMLCNILSFTGELKVSAAGNVDLVVNLRQSLIEGTTNNTPETRTTSIPNDYVYMNWNILGAATENADYELSYPLDNGRRAIFTVNKTGQVANVSHKVQVFKDGLWSDISTDQNYRIYASRNAASKDNYLALDSFISGNYSGGDPNFRVVDTGSSSGVMTYLPEFVITKNRGFSFKYGQNTVYFRWNDQDQFEFVTNGIVQGRIYSFTLKSNERDSTAYSVSTKNILTGIATDEDNFKVIPTASNGKTIEDRLIRVGSRQDDFPGTPDVGMIIQFQEPMGWDGNTATFSKPSDNVLKTSFTFGYDDKSTVNQKEFTLLIDDISADAPSIIDIAPSNGPKAVIKRDATSPSALNIVISNLQAGTIYDSTTNVSVTSIRDVLETKGGIDILPVGRVHTFLEYEIVPRSGEYAVLIKPYENMSGFYTLYASAGPGGDPTEVAIVRESDGSNTILQMPLTITSINEQQLAYQVAFSPVTINSTATPIRSQILEYKASALEPDIDSPKFFEVVDVDVDKNKRTGLTPIEGDTSGEEAILTLLLKWDIGEKSVIDKILELAPGNKVNIVYDVNQSLSPDDLFPARFARVNLEIKGTSESGLTVTYTGIDGSGNKVTGPVNAKLNVQSNLQTNQFRYLAEPDLSLRAAYKSSTGVTGLEGIDFLYPNIYFLNVKPISLEGVEKILSGSMYDSLTLSSISKLEVPPPQNMTAYDPITTSVSAGEYKEETSFKLSWRILGSQIQEFVNSYAFPPENADISMNLYVSQNEDALRTDKYERKTELGNNTEFYNLNLEDRGNYSKISDYESNYSNNERVLYFSDIEGHSGMTMTRPTYSNPRDALRNNNILQVKDIALTVPEKRGIIASGASLNLAFTIDGLDKNQKYYAYADIVVTLKDSVGATKLVKSSLLSSIVGVTTEADKTVPAPEEKIPSAPNLSYDKDSVTQSQVLLFWNRIPTIESGEKIEYELIRTKDRQMDEKYLNNRDPINRYWEEYISGSKDILRTSGSSAVEKYDGTKYVETNPLIYPYAGSSTPITLTDSTLSANGLYFYYLRAVKTVTSPLGEKVELRSVWTNVSVTTVPVQAPKNLIVDTARTNNPGETDAIIDFDVPVPFGSLSKIGKEYNLQYQLKKEGEDWSSPVTMNAATLIANATQSNEEGYSHLWYKITGLESGTSYTVRVRMSEISGDASMYSNNAIFKTVINQKDYDDKIANQNWLDFLEDELNKLFEDPYWELENDRSDFSAVYRPSMFAGLLAESPDGYLELAGADSKNYIYYLPATALLEAISAGKSFKITHGNMDVIIPAQAIDPQFNAAIETISGKIKSGDLKDYYVRIKLSWSDFKSQINGSEPLTQKLDISVELVGSLMDNKKWDNSLIEKLKELINEKVDDSDILSEIKEMIRDGDSDEDKLKFIREVIEDTKEEFMETVDDELDDVLKGSYSVTNFDRPVNIVVNSLDSSTTVQGYYYVSSGWIAQDTIDYAAGKAMRANSPGSYIFGGSSINIVGLENIPNAAKITGIVTKYGLDDFFGKGLNFNLEQAATRYMVVGSIARIAGAPKGSDPVDWLNKNRGTLLSTRNLQENIDQQEAVYLMMVLYEIKTNSDVSKIQVRNYTAMSSIQGIDDKYKPYIRAAFETGIYTSTNMQPQASMKVKDVLSLLSSLDAKVKL